MTKTSCDFYVAHMDCRNSEVYDIYTYPKNPVVSCGPTDEQEMDGYRMSGTFGRH